MRTQVNAFSNFRMKFLALILLAGLCLPASAQWSNIYTGTNTFDVDPVNDSTWYMSQYYVLKKTTNYGATWTTIVPYLLDNNIEEMFFLNENNYWLVGYDNTGSNILGWVYHTSDGGLTFQTTLTSQSYGYLTGVWFTSATTGYVTSVHGQVLKSINGGTSFLPSFTSNTEPLRQIRFYNANTGLAVGDNGAAFLTTNAGGSWSPMGISATCDFTDIEMISSQDYIVAGSEGIYRTTDGGANWTQVLTGYVDRVDFPTTSVGYAGGYGTFYKTTDGGQSWLGVNGFATYYTSEIFFMDANHGYAANTGGIWETTNGVSNCPTVNAGIDQHICGAVTNLQAIPSANNAYVYSWSPSAGLGTPNSVTTVANSPNPSQTVTIDYVVTMTDTFTGCPAVTDTVEVIFDSLHFVPNYTQSTNLLYLCPGDMIQINPASGGVSYTWFGIGGPISAPYMMVDSIESWNVNIVDCAGGTHVYGFFVQYGSSFVPNYPSLNNTVYMCTNDTLTLNVGYAATNYVWSTGATTPSIQVFVPDTYTCVVNHCTAVDTFNFFVQPLYCDSVWPGDAGYDGIANMYDLLNLGIAFGSTGAPRVDQSLGWYAHYAVDWAGSFTSIGTNYKHADCDGDGMVDYPDTTAIIQNYGQVHTINPIMGVGGPNDPPLYFSGIPPQVEESEAITIPIYLGSSVLPTTDFYGGAFSINYDTTFIQPNSVHITFNPSWVGTVGTSTIAISKNIPNEQRIDLAIARTDQQPISGYGEIAQLHIIMQDDISALINQELWLIGALMNLSFDNEKFINHLEEEIIINSLPVDISVLTGVEANEDVALFSVYPNPADQFVSIQSPGTTLKQIEVIDLQGRTLMVQSTSSSLVLLNIAMLDAGVYAIRCQMENGTTGLQRLIVR